MVKRYIEFIRESNSTIPENYIELRKDDYYFNPDDGNFGFIDSGGDLLEMGFIGDYLDGLSLNDEELSIVDKYYKSCESVLKDKVNYDLIDLVYDLGLSEGLFDNDCILVIKFNLSDRYVYDKKVTLLEYTASKLGEDYEYVKMFNGKLKELEKENNFDYEIHFRGGWSDFNSIKERIEVIIRSEFSDLKIEFI